MLKNIDHSLALKKCIKTTTWWHYDKIKLLIVVIIVKLQRATFLSMQHKFTLTAQSPASNIQLSVTMQPESEEQISWWFLIFCSMINWCSCPKMAWHCVSIHRQEINTHKDHERLHFHRSPYAWLADHQQVWSPIYTVSRSICSLLIWNIQVCVNTMQDSS